ncbi:coatomer subunit gamma-2 [Apiospora arundinis]
MDQQLSRSVQNRAPTILTLPREIRNKIYSYFVTVDQVFEGLGNGDDFLGNIGFNFNDVFKFSFSRQTRTEAWDYLIASNIWIRLVDNPTSREFFFEYLKAYAPSWFPRLLIPFGRVPTEYRSRISRAVGIQIGMQEDTPTNDPNSIDGARRVMIFPYHPLAYKILIRELYFEGVALKPLTAWPAIPTLDCARRFDKLITPFLGTSHPDEGVVFEGANAAHPRLGPLQEALRRPQQDAEPIDDMIALKMHFYKQGRIAESRGHYTDAMCQYFVGLNRTFSGRNEFDITTPERSSLDSMDTDLHISFCRSAHKYVARLKKRVASHDIVHSHVKWIIEKGIDAAESAMTFIGLTDSQRMEAHLYHAFNRLHYAEYWENSASSDESDTVLVPNRTLHRGNCTINELANHHYLEAAREFFYATEVDPSRDMVASLDEEDLAVFKKIQQRPGPKAFELAVEEEIPLLGRWSGCPGLWSMWDEDEVLLMKQFRLRHNLGPDGDVGTPENLVTQYALQGITWTQLSRDEIDVSVNQVA